jgi:hypothetical protein
MLEAKNDDENGACNSRVLSSVSNNIAGVCVYINKTLSRLMFSLIHCKWIYEPLLCGLCNFCDGGGGISPFFFFSVCCCLPGNDGVSCIWDLYTQAPPPPPHCSVAKS